MQLEAFVADIDAKESVARQQAMVNQPNGFRYQGPDGSHDLSKAHVLLLKQDIYVGSVVWASAASGDGVEPKLTYHMGSR